MKHLIPIIIALAASGLCAHSQTVINMTIQQNPLFEVSTNQVEALMPDGGMLLGGDIVIVGGSGTYSYLWTDSNGDVISKASTITINTPGIYTLDVSDTCDCHQIVEFNIQSAGIDDVLTDADMVISVVDKRLHIKSSNTVNQVSVVAMSGELVAVIPYPSEDIDLSCLQSGTYIICVKIGDKIHSLKSMI